ncbi:MAG: HAMP domain-containing histidine kinase [Cytophagales bacterium]|nr:HAMP domain-containing histidine kinase [Cytophagales bacterium]
MTKNKLRLIIGLMGVAIVGLLVLQFYWIKDSIAENRKKFDRLVQTALNQVSASLEEMEVIHTAQKSYISSTSRQLNLQFDSLTLQGIYSFNTPPVYFPVDSLGRRSIFSDRVSVDIKEKNDAFEFLYSPHQGKDNRIGLTSEKFRIRLQHVDQRVDSVRSLKENKFDRVREYSQFVTFVVDAMFAKERKLENRINPIVLDSLLRMELRQKGIRSAYLYAVRMVHGDSLLLTNALRGEPAPHRSDFRTNLFKRDIEGSPSYLQVDFPNRNRFLFGKIWLRLFSSVLLILIILSAFAYSIYTIISQKKLSDIKNDFINNMTHELKTPISTISLACEAMNDREMRQVESIMNRYLGIIKEENRRLGTQVEKVLQIAALEKKNFNLNFERLDVHKLILKSIEGVRLRVENEKGKIDLLLNAPKHHMEIDRLHLTNIIDNILDNAVKYCWNRSPHIVLSTESAEEGIIIRIADNGIGMSRETVRHIFEKFYRVPSGNIHNVKGFGLGLAYVKMMVDAMSGSVKVFSALDEGTTFEIFLPYEQDENTGSGR